MQKHIRKAVDILKSAGATEIEIGNGRHFRIEFTLNGKPESLTISSSPRQPELIPSFISLEIRKLNRRQST